jgi:phosphoribosyl 1,2-cyclic phosphodiesterase
VRVHVCGARGSTPAPGPEFVRYGGHTSCVALSHDGGRPALVIDAGTGIRKVTALLDGAPFRGTILLSHLHWDHTQGLPFFSGADDPGARVRLLLPAQAEPVALLERMISPPYFPIGPRQFRGEWAFEEIVPGEHSLEGFTVVAAEIPHKGGRMFGYRISDGRATFTYMSDHSPVGAGAGDDGLGAYHEDALKLARGCDLLAHDAQHTAAEFPRLAFLGHAAVEYAVELGRRAGARRVLLFHHDPGRTDDAIDELRRAAGGAPAGVEAAVEGSVIDLP